MAVLTVPVGELGSLGIIKEAAFGVFPGAPTLFHGLNTLDMKEANVPVARSPIRKRYGQSRPGTGAFTVGGTIDVESTPDTFAQLLAYALGVQSVPSLDVVALNLSAATIIGATSFPVGASFPVGVVAGETISIDTSTNLETLTVANPAISVAAGVYSINTTAGATKAHANGVAVALTSTSAYVSTLKLGALPSFSMELNRVLDAIDYTGCMVDQLSLDLKPKTGLQAKFTLVCKSLVKNASPTTPTFSTKQPVTFEHPHNQQFFNGIAIGAGGECSTLGLTVTLNNNLDKSYFSGASGRTVQNFPQQQRTGKVALTLGFETSDAWEAMLGDGVGNAPAAISVPTFEFVWLCCAPDLADSTLGVPYQIGIILPNLYPTGDPIAMKGGALQQAFEAELSESGNGNNDDVTIAYVGTDSAAF